jgi:hypothetical protein
MLGFIENNTRFASDIAEFRKAAIGTRVRDDQTFEHELGISNDFFVEGLPYRYDGIVDRRLVSKTLVPSANPQTHRVAVNIAPQSYEEIEEFLVIKRSEVESESLTIDTGGSPTSKTFLGPSLTYRVTIDIASKCNFIKFHAGTPLRLVNLNSVYAGTTTTHKYDQQIFGDEAFYFDPLLVEYFEIEVSQPFGIRSDQLMYLFNVSEIQTGLNYYSNEWSIAFPLQSFPYDIFSVDLYASEVGITTALSDDDDVQNAISYEVISGVETHPLIPHDQKVFALSTIPTSDTRIIPTKVVSGEAGNFLSMGVEGTVDANGLWEDGHDKGFPSGYTQTGKIISNTADSFSDHRKYYAQITPIDKYIYYARPVLNSSQFYLKATFHIFVGDGTKVPRIDELWTRTKLKR